MFDFLNGPVRTLVTQIYDAVGYVGVAMWVAIESVIIPIPSELVLPFAGFLIGEGAATEPLTGSPWNYWLTVLAGTLGATVGALIAYGIGAWGGRPILERWGRWLGITADDLDRADAFFAKHGEAASFFGRMIPVIRSLVSKEGDHERGTYHLKTGYRPDPSLRHPSLGSILVNERPASGLALPSHVAIDGGQWPPRGGFLGDEFDAFRVTNPGGPVSNIASGVPADRQRRRLDGLDVLERSFARGRPTERTLHGRTVRDALTLMDSDQLKAFEEIFATFAG